MIKKSPSQQLLMHKNWRNGRNVWLKEGGFFWREFETTLSRVFMGRRHRFSMWKKLKDLYQNNSDQRKLVLKDKLQKIKCEKGDMISTYLNKLTTYKDELRSVGITIDDDDMVSLALLGLPKN